MLLEEEEELTPLEDCRPLEDEEVDELDEVEEVELEVPDEVEAVGVLEDEEVPGMVAALTALRRPTPAKAAKAVP